MKRGAVDGHEGAAVAVTTGARGNVSSRDVLWAGLGYDLKQATESIWRHGDRPP